MCAPAHLAWKLGGVVPHRLTANTGLAVTSIFAGSGRESHVEGTFGATIDLPPGTASPPEAVLRAQRLESHGFLASEYIAT